MLVSVCDNVNWSSGSLREQFTHFWVSCGSYRTAMMIMCASSSMRLVMMCCWWRRCWGRGLFGVPSGVHDYGSAIVTLIDLECLAEDALDRVGRLA